MNEKEIISLCQRGQMDYFGRLYEDYVDRIYKYICLRTKSKEVAEDLTSRTFEKAIERLNQYSQEKGPFSAWLYTIARNNIIDFIRGDKVNVELKEATFSSKENDIERGIDQRKQIREVIDFLETLEAEQKDLVVMRIWEGLSYKEISSVVGKTEGSLKMSFSRVMTKLTQSLVSIVFLLAFIIHYNG